MNKWLLWIGVLFTGMANAQVPDSLIMPIDSLLQAKLSHVDSIQNQTAMQLNSLKQEYDSVENAVNSLSDRYQQKIDSLNNLSLPTESLTSKIDSINNLKEQKLSELQSKTEELKQKTLGKIESLDLPPELSDQLSNYTQSLEQFDITLLHSEINIPVLDLPGMSVPEIPGINASLPKSINDLPTAQLPDDLKQVAEKVKSIQQELPEAPTAESIAKKAEEKATELAKEKIGDVPGMPEVPADGEAAKQELINQAKKQAIDHFAGKQDKLQAAMDQMAKYKQKYSSVQSIKDLPKKAPNEMKGKPWQERLVPGVTLQIQKRNDWWFDLNPYVGYRFTGRITAGLGWNERIAYDFSSGKFNSQARVYGPRIYGDYRLKKGFVPHIEVECLNTPVRALPDQVYTHREWVWSVMAGMKKEYRISKTLRGNAQILYNLFDPDYKSPYTERLNVRMGVEYIIRKQKKE